MAATRPACGNRLDDRPMHALHRLGAEARAQAQRVRPGGERLDGGSDPDGRGDALHVERIRDHKAGEAELLPQQAAEDPRAHRGRDVVELRDANVCAHDRVHARVDRGPERQQRRVEVACHRRQLVVRVELGVAVAGEVLRTRRDADGLHPAHEGRDVPRHELRLGAERADPDHRVPRVRVHVGDRREVEVHANRGEVGADRRAHLLRERDVVHHAEREVPRIRAAAIVLEPRHVAALLVDHDEQAAQLGRQRGHLLRARNVTREEHDAAQAPLDPAPQPVGRRQTRESRQEDSSR
jgi:hypothetical protein